MHGTPNGLVEEGEKPVSVRPAVVAAEVARPVPHDAEPLETHPRPDVPDVFLSRPTSGPPDREGSSRGSCRSSRRAGPSRWTRREDLTWLTTDVT